VRQKRDSYIQSLLKAIKKDEYTILALGCPLQTVSRLEECELAAKYIQEHNEKIQTSLKEKKAIDHITAEGRTTSLTMMLEEA
jgi:aspartate carbamoyltransferase regulatory subunit